MSSSVATTTIVEAPTRTLAGKLSVDEVDDTKHSAKQKEDFFWAYTEEPHRTRRQAIIKAHPEVSRVFIPGRPAGKASQYSRLWSQILKLCGPEPLTKWLVLGVVSLQVLCAYLLRDTPFFSWTFFLTAYIIGATSNQNLFLAIHEISHNLASKSPQFNRILAIFANLPIGIPYYASFRVSTLTLGNEQACV